MPIKAQKIRPEEFILSALSREERLEAALAVAGEAFKRCDLTMEDVESAVKSIRKKAHGKRK